MDDYGELVGREVESLTNGVTYVVAGIDPEIGITLHRKYDPRRKMCLIHPEVIMQREEEGSELYHADLLVKLMRAYKESFEHWVNGIKKGCFTKAWRIEEDNIFSKYGVEEYSSSLPIACPFE